MSDFLAVPQGEGSCTGNDSSAGNTGDSRRHKPVSLPAAQHSGRLLIRIAPSDVGLFRFLLEACDNLALFTMLENRTALLKLLFSPHQRQAVLQALERMKLTVDFCVEEWPFAQND